MRFPASTSAATSGARGLVGGRRKMERGRVQAPIEVVLLDSQMRGEKGGGRGYKELIWGNDAVGAFSSELSYTPPLHPPPQLSDKKTAVISHKKDRLVCWRSKDVENEILEVLGASENLFAIRLWFHGCITSRENVMLSIGRLKEKNLKAQQPTQQSK
jgi:hypothetical protein